jgi:hypothetical protein
MSQKSYRKFASAKIAVRAALSNFLPHVATDNHHVTTGN